MPEILIRPLPLSDEFLIQDENPDVFWNTKMNEFTQEYLSPIAQNLEKNASLGSSEYLTMEIYAFRRLQDCISSLNATNDDDGFIEQENRCSVAFDGWTCWPATKPGTYAQTNCPEFPILAFQAHRFTRRYCMPNGQWWIHPSSNKTWSNYTECIDTEQHEYHASLNTLMTIGLSLSLVLLTVSLILFYVLGLMKSGRVKMHRNLFVSNCMSNIFWLIWYHAVLGNPVVISENKFPCIMIHIIKTYLMVLNYFWMFCEGLYLQVLLNTAFSNDQQILWIELIGWIGPLPIIGSYVVYRIFSPLENQHCWMTYGSSQLFLSLPVSLIVILNAVSFLNVLRIVKKKINHPDFHLPNGVVYYQQAKTIARTTLLLFPILGLHYILIPFRPEKGFSGEFLYDLVSNTIVAFQGSVVSLLFCFFNGEVWNAVSFRWKRIQESRSVDRSCKDVSAVYRQNPRRHSSFSVVETTTSNRKGSTTARKDRKGVSFIPLTEMRNCSIAE